MIETGKWKPFLSDFARFFSPAVLRDLARSNRSGLVETVSTESGLLEQLGSLPTYADVFERTYQLLLESYRCEYVFKNAISSKLLAERHILEHSSVFYEFRIDGRIADVVVFNGTSTAYEIKTDLDRLDRLQDQLQAFMRSFDRIYVVSEESRQDELADELPKSIGQIVLTRNGDIRQIRRSLSHEEYFDAAPAFDTFRTSEYTGFLRALHGTIPTVPSWQLYDVCKRLYCALPPSATCQIFRDTLRARLLPSRQRRAVDAGPESLKAALLNSKLSSGEWNVLPDVLDRHIYIA